MDKRCTKKCDKNILDINFQEMLMSLDKIIYFRHLFLYYTTVMNIIIKDCCVWSIDANWFYNYFTFSLVCYFLYGKPHKLLSVSCYFCIFFFPIIILPYNLQIIFATVNPVHTILMSDMSHESPGSCTSPAMEPHHLEHNGHADGRRTGRAWESQRHVETKAR